MPQRRSLRRSCLFASVLLVLASCTTPPVGERARTFDLEISQPSPRANYVQVTPARPGVALPPPGGIVSQDFSRYLRDRTGCVFDVSRRAAAIGNKQVPAGYMIPVSCP